MRHIETKSPYSPACCVTDQQGNTKALGLQPKPREKKCNDFVQSCHAYSFQISCLVGVFITKDSREIQWVISL